MRLIKNWVLATFILCFLVILAGGIVRTTQSGMGCPDWPRCFGKWIPPTNAAQLPLDFEKYLGKQDIDHTFNAYHTWVEYINRLLGVLLGLFGLIQVLLFWNKRKANKQLWRLAISFLAMVILTGLFGAIVVKYNLAHLSISVHLFFAIVLVQIQMALWLVFTNRYKNIVVDYKVKKIIWVLMAVLLIQSIMGTIVRMHVDDISKLLGYNQRQIWLADLPYVFIVHRSFSWVVVLVTALMVWKNKKIDSVKNKIFALAAIILLNMFVGIILYYADIPAAAQPVHLLLAALAITQTLSVLLQTKAVKR